ncbi:MAG: M48 family metallopeptidase [Thermoanaerobaculia bacterium]
MRSRVPSMALAAWLLLTGGTFVAAQEEAVETADAAEPGVAAELEVAAGAETAAQSFDPQAATETYLDRLTPEEKDRSDNYFEGGYWLQLWGFLYGLGIAWLFLGTGLTVRMRDLAGRISRRRPLRTMLYTCQYLILATVLYFPLTVYRDFIREHQYGLATQTFGPWFREQLIDLGLSLVLFSILLVPLYGVFRRAPKTWWLWGSIVSVAFLIFAVLIAPVTIDPLFNTYVPLEDENVREPILSIARANGIEVDRVYQYDASRQTTRISANVSGFLGTMRIRLNDNLLDRCSLTEIKAVMGHEIGHYVLNHVYESIPFFAVVIVVGFAFIRWSFDRVLARWGGKWGVKGLGDVAGLPLLAALFSVYFFVLTPFLNTYIRSNEAEADLFGLNAAAEPDGVAEVALKLSEYRKLDPGPLEEWILYDHPSGRSRISMAMHWKAEHLRE